MVTSYEGVVPQVEVLRIVNSEAFLPTNVAYSGQITVSTPGTSIQGGNTALINGVYIKALSTNTGKMYIGYASGDNRAMFELSPGEIIIVQVSNLNQVWIDASVAGEKVCWLKA